MGKGTRSSKKFCSWKCGNKRQSVALRAAMAKPEYKITLSKAVCKALSNPEVRNRKSEVMHVLLANPEYRKQHNKRAANQCKKRKSEKMLLLWTDPGYRNRRARAHCAAMAKPEVRAKQHATMKRNGSYGKSKVEDRYFLKLEEQYGKGNVERQKPYGPGNKWAADFYIPLIDKFIEVQGNWTHGGEPFDANNSLHQEILQKWKKKAESSLYYQIAVQVWTVTDPEKRKWAKDNNLDWEEIFSKRQ